jgi:hypothetical protein
VAKGGNFLPFDVPVCRPVDDRLECRCLARRWRCRRFAGGFIPHDRGLSLVGDTDRGDVVAGDVRFGEGLADHFGCCPKFPSGCVRPSRAWEDLFVLQLAGERSAGMVEDDGAVLVVPWSIDRM